MYCNLYVFCSGMHPVAMTNVLLHIYLGYTVFFILAIITLLCSLIYQITDLRSTWKVLGPRLAKDKR